MDDNELVNVNFMDLDLNREPVDPPLHRVARYGSSLNELETAHERIDERIRQLEAVEARARQRQRWREARNSIESSYIPSENNDIGVGEVTAERGKGCKRDSSHLAGRALEMYSEVKKDDKDGGSFYDCNICLGMAREPVLTCCGHLFCWPCFYRVSYVDATTKECPVCKGEVSESAVTPIYGNGDGDRDPVCETESGVIIPPRPKARRIEGVRQCHVTHVPVAEAIRRIRNSIATMDGQMQELESSNGSLTRHNSEVVGGHGIGIHQVSRVLSESAASLSSLSSTLSNAERLVEDLETTINNRMLQNDSARVSTALSSDNQQSVTAADINTALATGSSTQSTSRILRMRNSNDISLPVAPSSSSVRRRSIMSRISDLDIRDLREARRRRLN